eukprot:m.358182 g.358182  ORF g.358182 m.358182 type:complete len:606 (+) comp18067_c0_seq1:56-1873(+)
MTLSRCVVMLSAVLAVLSLASVGAGSVISTSKLVNTLKTQGTYSLAAAYAAASALAAANEATPKNFCDVLSSIDDQSLTDVFQATQIAVAANCQFKKGSAVVKASLKSDDVQTLYQAVLAAKVLGVFVDAGKVLSQLKSTLKGKYTVRMAGYAFTTAAALDVEADQLKSISSAASNVCNQLLVSEGTAYFDGGLTATAIVTKGVFDLAAALGKQSAFTSSQVTMLAEYFAQSRFSTDVVRAAGSLIGLATTSLNKFQAAMVITPVVTEAGTDGAFTVTVTNYLGNPVEAAKVTLTKLKGSNFKVVAENVALSSSAGVYKLKAGQLNVAPGTYTAQFTATAKNMLSAQATSRVVITTSAVITDASLTVGSEQTAVTFPNTLSDAVEVKDAKPVLKFKVKPASGSAFRAHQAMVQLTSKDNNQEAVFVATYSSDTYTVSMNVASALKYVNGAYDMTVMVGDAAISPALMWNVGVLNIEFENSAPAPSPSATPYDSQPEIQHMFREPDSRPPAIVSLAFTALCLAPLAVLFMGWSFVGANADALKVNLSTLTFFGSLAAILLLFISFWLYLNLMQCMAMLVPLLAVLFFSARSTLRDVATERVMSKTE